METKTCKTCKIEYPNTLEYFNGRIVKDYRTKNLHSKFWLYTQCISCKKQRDKDYYYKNKESIKETRNKSLRKRSEKVKVVMKNYYINNLQSIKIKAKKTRERDYKKTYEKRVPMLSNGYIKQLIRKSTNLSDKDIPISLVEAWRQIVLIRRQLKTT